MGAGDGEVECPGYLDDEQSRALLAVLPFEHLAFDAQRISAGRILPRLINRLRRERLQIAQTSEPTALLLLLGARASAAGAAWALQSRPHCRVVEMIEGPDRIRDAASGASHVFFARDDDLLHPSAAWIVDRLQSADVVSWGRFCADRAVAGSGGTALRRGPFDLASARHGAMSDTTLAVRGAVLAGCPEDVLSALAQGRVHPLWFWLAGRGLSWRDHPEALTSTVAGTGMLSRSEVMRDEAVYLRILKDEGDLFATTPADEDLPFPHVLVPRRRAAEISVLIPFRNAAEATLRCVRSVAMQELSGRLELVLVDNRSDPVQAEAVVEGARQILGPARVTALSYDRPFNHSAQCNLAAQAARGEVVVLCNNDVVLRDPGLLEQLSAWALQPSVGTVGCRLHDPRRKLDSHGHVFAPPSADPFQPPVREDPDPTYGRFVRACAGNTLALAAIGRERLLALGGLDERRFPVGYNDIDLMLRGSAMGLTHLYLGHLSAQHERGSSRTGDNEDLQVLWIKHSQQIAALAHARQFVQQRVEGLRTDKDPVPARPSRTETPGPGRLRMLLRAGARLRRRLMGQSGGGGS